MKKLYLLLFIAILTMPVQAQQVFEKGKPNNDAYRYLDAYKGLKEYIDYLKYPNFKLGAGTTVYDYNQKGTFYKLINANFTETVAGNAMKMASCVDGNGNMNFTAVNSYVNNATNAGLNVYGHTLAWHSQQPKGWLLKLLADKPAPELTDGDVDIQTVVASKDFRTQQNVGWKASESENGYTLKYDATNGLKVTSTKSLQYQVQFVAMEKILLTKNKTYKMTVTVKGSKAGKIGGRLGDWSSGPSVNIPFTTEWQDVTINIKPTMESSFLLVQFPNFVGDAYIKEIKFEETKKGKTMNEERHCLVIDATAKVDQTWDNQF